MLLLLQLRPQWNVNLATVQNLTISSELEWKVIKKAISLFVSFPLYADAAIRVKTFKLPMLRKDGALNKFWTILHNVCDKRQSKKGRHVASTDKCLWTKWLEIFTLLTVPRLSEMVDTFINLFQRKLLPSISATPFTAFPLVRHIRTVRRAHWTHVSSFYYSTILVHIWIYPNPLLDSISVKDYYFFKFNWTAAIFHQDIAHHIHQQRPRCTIANITIHCYWKVSTIRIARRRKDGNFDYPFW